MHVATLLTHPDRPALDRATVDALRKAWGGGDMRWLNPGVAAEFPVEALPADRWDAWQRLQSTGIDLVLQSAAGRRKRFLIADMDSTMIEQECIDELADEAGVGAHVAGITARAMTGEIDFEAALEERVALLKGLPVAVIDRVVRQRITLASGGCTLLATMKAHGAHAAMVSGGFTAFTATIGGRLGFDETQANVLLTEGDRLSGKVAHPILGRDAKLRALESISARLGISPEGAIAVGDGANDLAMLHRAGTGVALHAKPSVAAQCDIRINHGDLTALLYIQGYARDEFTG